MNMIKQLTQIVFFDITAKAMKYEGLYHHMSKTCQPWLVTALCGNGSNHVNRMW